MKTDPTLSHYLSVPATAFRAFLGVDSRTAWKIYPLFVVLVTHNCETHRWSAGGSLMNDLSSPVRYQISNLTCSCTPSNGCLYPCHSWYTANSPCLRITHGYLMYQSQGLQLNSSCVVFAVGFPLPYHQVLPQNAKAVWTPGQDTFRYLIHKYECPIRTASLRVWFSPQTTSAPEAPLTYLRAFLSLASSQACRTLKTIGPWDRCSCPQPWDPLAGTPRLWAEHPSFQQQ